MFCKEHISFLVANFDTTYHAILGRLALTKFMARLHYPYMVLNMLAPGGVLSLQADLAVAYACEKESLALAEAFDLSTHMDAYLTESKKVPLELQEIPTMEAHREDTKAKETKEMSLGLADPSKTEDWGPSKPQIGRHAHQLPGQMYSHGNLRTCLECRGS